MDRSRIEIRGRCSGAARSYTSSEMAIPKVTPRSSG
jgi:hypothetical protein